MSLIRRLLERITGIPFDNGYRWLYPYIFISFIVALLSIATFIQTMRSMPRVSYDLLHVPERTAYCPGDEIEWSVDIRLTGNGFERLEIVRTIWNVDEERTVIFDTEPEYSVIFGEEAQAHPRLSYTVPDLPPGRYELRVAASGNLTRVTGYAIPFTVPEGCG